MKLAFSLFNMGSLGKDHAMESNKEQGKEETFEDIDKMKERDTLRRYKELQIRRMEKEVNGGNTGQKPVEDRTMEQLEKDIRIKSMRKALNDDSGGMNLDKMIQLKMMDRMFTNPEKSGDSQAVQALQTQLNLIQQQMQQERNIAQQNLQNEKVLQKLEQFANSGKQPDQFKEYVQEINKVNAARDLKIREIEAVRDKEKDATIKISMDTKMKELETQIQMAQQYGGMGKKRLKELQEEVTAVKEMGKLLGQDNDKEKTAGDYISETVAGTAEKLAPALQAWAERGRQQPPQPQPLAMQHPQAPNPPTPLEPQPLESDPKSDLTRSEKEISDRSSEIYGF